MVLEYINALKWWVLAAGGLFVFRSAISKLLSEITSGDMNFGSLAKFSFNRQVTDAEKEAGALSKAAADSKPADGTAELSVTATMTAEAEVSKPIEVPALDEAKLRVHARVPMFPRPGAAAAAALTIEERRAAERHLLLLRAFSRMKVDEAWFRKAKTDPALALVNSGKRLFGLLARSDDPDPWELPELWPETPANIVEVLQQLHRLWISAKTEPSRVTLNAAYGYRNAACDWAGAYADFLDGALAGVVRLGTRMLLSELKSDGTIKRQFDYTIAIDSAADPKNTRYASSLPASQALLGHIVGDIVDTTIDGKPVKVRIQAVTTTRP
ncbi:hypothetical protein C8259_09005 [Nocardia nova]|uniref:Uncharacterized protein n=2 Tax=Nocardiaceae TaxID=85025 RepID=A0A2T2Z8C6_9NOCA|nr:hypothetical protein C8259_09005 [Nocardia nova]